MKFKIGDLTVAIRRRRAQPWRVGDGISRQRQHIAIERINRLPRLKQSPKTYERSHGAFVQQEYDHYYIFSSRTVTKS